MEVGGGLQRGGDWVEQGVGVGLGSLGTATMEVEGDRSEVRNGLGRGSRVGLGSSRGRRPWSSPLLWWRSRLRNEVLGLTCRRNCY